MLITLIWFTSIAATWPIFSSYKLSTNEPASASAHSPSNQICDSLYHFPDDVAKIRLVFLNYLIYALGVPCFLILILLGVLYILQSSICSKPSASAHSATSTPLKKPPKTASLSSSSFDETATTASSSLSAHHQTCTKSTGSSSALLLWLMFGVHVATSLPQELYRYMQLSIDFRDESVLEDYFTSVLVHPIVKARPYYAMQLFYVAEFVLQPVLFILFYLCSNVSASSRDSDANVNIVVKERRVGFLGQLRKCFYDSDLSKAHGCLTMSHKSSSKARRRPHFVHNVQNNDVLLPVARESSFVKVKSSKFLIF